MAAAVVVAAAVAVEAALVAVLAALEAVVATSTPPLPSSGARCVAAWLAVAAVMR